jgi:hypothetical protein
MSYGMNNYLQLYCCQRLRCSEQIDAKERGRNNFHNYASQRQTTFTRSQIPKASKQLAIPSTFVI